MPKVAKGRRKRAYHPKTRTGCLTCRVRRVKCDEARPVCVRCASTRRICDGYYHVESPPSSHSFSESVAILAGPSFDIQIPSSSKRSFVFFVEQTCPQLAGFFRSEFWERHVLQAAYHESAIRHAIVAIGSLHEALECKTGTSHVTEAFVLEQYNHAIKDLLGPFAQNEKQSVDVCLISCILFTCFENMQGRHASAGCHIRSGVKLLSEIVEEQRTGTTQNHKLCVKSAIGSYTTLEALAKVFAGLGSQPAREIVQEYSSGQLGHNFALSMLGDVPLSISSIEEAKNLFDYGQYLLTSGPISTPIDDPAPMIDIAAFAAHAQYCTSLIEAFLQALEKFEAENRALFSPQETSAVAVLRLHVLNAQVTLHLERLPPACQPSWLEFMPQMQEMAALGEKIVSGTSSRYGLPSPMTSFCLDMGFIIPLWTLASNCRDSAVRRRVITTLRSVPRQEGLWNSILIAKAIERVMEIENEVHVEVMGYINDCGWSGTLNIKPVLELDSRGGRLQYIRQDTEKGAPVKVSEDIWSW